MNKVVTRFAPSPTGHLHIGGARTAIFCWLLARHFGGEFHLRIEDTDLLRSKQEYTDSILASMRWLGLDWDGPLNYQTQRTELYNSYVDKLLETGHAYWCSCTPEEVEAMREKARAQGLKPRYNGCCRERNLGPGEGRCVRLKAPQAGKVVFDDMVKGRIAVDVSELDDMVIRRADGMPTYNMAVVVDDYEMGITHVIRGDDHVSNTPRQILIYEALGLPVPTFGHVPMILGPDRQKLSKRHGARAVIEYQNDGLLPQALVNYLVRLGWSRPSWSGSTPTSCARCPWTNWPSWCAPSWKKPVCPPMSPTTSWPPCATCSASAPGTSRPWPSPSVPCWSAPTSWPMTKRPAPRT